MNHDNTGMVASNGSGVPAAPGPGLLDEHVWRESGDWLTQVGEDAHRYTISGWRLAYTVSGGIRDLGGGDRDMIADLYRAAAEASGRSTKTLQNMVSALNRWGPIIPDLFVDGIPNSFTIGHAIALLGLPDEQAMGVALTACENSLTVAQTKAVAYGMPMLPDDGSISDEDWIRREDAATVVRMIDRTLAVLETIDTPEAHTLRGEWLDLWNTRSSKQTY